MVSEYSPSTDDVRDAYLDQRDWSTDAATAFDAWIAGVRAAARREGWRECARAWDEGYRAGSEDMSDLRAGRLTMQTITSNPYLNGEDQ